MKTKKTTPALPACYCLTIDVQAEGKACPVCGQFNRNPNCIRVVCASTFGSQGRQSPITAAELQAAFTSPPPAPAVPVKSAAPATPAPAPAPVSTLPAWILAYRAALQQNRLNVAAGIIFGVAKMEQAVEWLTLVDTVAAKRGYLLDKEVQFRRDLVLKAIKILDFNPGKEDGPRSAPTSKAQVIPIARAVEIPWGSVLPPAPEAPKALGSGVLEPLKSGDWAELGRRVAIGALSAEDAQAFGRIWIEHGAVKGG